MFFSTGSAQAKDINYYGGDSNSYNFEMLRHVLSYHVDKNYIVRSFPNNIPKQRAYRMLAKNDGIDVVYGGATIEREQLNHPVRIPLLKGLNGWRIPLVKKSNTNLIAQQKSLEDFKQLLAGQFHLWSDVAILESNNVRVHKATNTVGIFQMLDKGRFDYFPRSVLEIWPEMEKHKNLDIMIEQHSFIHYPSAYYFYVNHQNIELANDLQQGLEIAIKDGSFDALFNQHYGDVIVKARQTPRKTYELNNPYLSPETPLDRQEFWIDLGIKPVN
jgi:hypothetical protein